MLFRSNLIAGSSHLNFKISKDLPVVIEVVDTETEEVIRVIPAEVLQELYKSLSNGEKPTSILLNEVI